MGRWLLIVIAIATIYDQLSVRVVWAVKTNTGETPSRTTETNVITGGTPVSTDIDLDSDDEDTGDTISTTINEINVNTGDTPSTTINETNVNTGDTPSTTINGGDSDDNPNKTGKMWGGIIGYTIPKGLPIVRISPFQRMNRVNRPPPFTPKEEEASSTEVPSTTSETNPSTNNKDIGG